MYVCYLVARCVYVQSIPSVTVEYLYIYVCSLDDKPRSALYSVSTAKSNHPCIYLQIIMRLSWVRPFEAQREL